MELAGSGDFAADRGSLAPFARRATSGLNFEDGAPRFSPEVTEHHTATAEFHIGPSG